MSTRAREAAFKARWHPVAGDTYGVRAIIYRKRKAGDWDNFVKGIQDAMRGIIFPDDALVQAGTGVMFTDPKNPRVHVEVTAFAGGVLPAALSEMRVD